MVEKWDTCEYKHKIQGKPCLHPPSGSEERMQEFLDKLTPQLQSTTGKLTTNRQLRDNLLQEMCLHLCQLWYKEPNQTLK